MSDQAVSDTENGPPKYRVLLGLNHTWANDLSLSVRGNWYGGYTNENDSNPGQFQEFSDLVQVDMMLNWNFSNGRLAMTAGGTSIFDEQPARVEFEMWYDNSIERATAVGYNGNRPVSFGGPTWDEMDLGWMNFTDAEPVATSSD